MSAGKVLAVAVVDKNETGRVLAERASLRLFVLHMRLWQNDISNYKSTSNNVGKHVI